MKHPRLSQASALRSLALTVEEIPAGKFRWRILEAPQGTMRFESLTCADTFFADYDAALATGYGELQRLIGPDLQHGPRHDPVSLAASRRQSESIRV